MDLVILRYTIRKICRYYKLLESGGSDFHGANKADIQIGTGRGNLRIPQEFAEKMKDVLGSGM